MLKQARTNRLLIRSIRVNAITPAGHKSIEHAAIVKVSPQVPLQIEDADMNQHVRSLQTGQLCENGRLCRL